MYWLDSYERTARLTPGLLLLVPIAIVFVGFGFPLTPWSATLAGLVLAVAGPVVLAKHVGNRGRSLEDTLYQSWGGPPTTLLLRPPAHGELGPILAQRRSNVERASKVTLPDGSGPDHGADAEVYKAAVLTIRSKTTDHARFPLVFAENKSYGFERNLLGVKTEGLVASGVCVLGPAGALILAILGPAPLDPTSLGLAFAANTVILVFWTIWPTSKRVEDAGTRYAERLLDAASAVAE